MALDPSDGVPGPSQTEDPAAMPSCDVVMKGGITSGVIYPPLVARLAERYRLRSIGGTSAGAIAAAAAAAAQLGRLQGHGDSFARLAALPGDLGQAGMRRGSSVLRELFQPSAATAGPFRVLTAAMQQGTKRPREGGSSAAQRAARVARVGWALVRSYPTAALCGILPGALLVIAAARAGGTIGDLAVLVAVGTGLLAMAVALVARLVVSLLASLPHNFHGMCTGMPELPAAGGPPALTPWLADLLDSLAGKPADGDPLTFGDLWGCRPAADAAGGFPPEQERRVHLQMTTTCVTLGRPFTLPFVDQRFFFHPAEMRRFFPERVVRWMEQHPRRPAREGDPVVGGVVLPTLPAPADLPLVVAARMSSSFPLLLAAVPLWAVDYSRKHNRRLRGEGQEGDAEDAGDADAVEPLEPSRAPADAERCWFSDGGACSNFPVHFFDRPLPGWPTFGINLRPFHPDYRNRPVFLAVRGGLSPEWWTRLRPGLASVPSFLATLLDTMQAWRDNAQIGVHGYRERVAHVSHRESEGGLNLDMPAEVIAELGARGQLAADRLIAAFDPGAPDGAWPQHRWTRLRSTMGVLEETLEGLADAYREHRFAPLLARGAGDPPSRYRMTVEQAADARGVLERLLAVVESWEEFDGEVFRRGAPSPQPELRITPRV